MGLISAKGNEAVQSAGKSAVDLSEIMIRLKDKEAVKVRLLSAEDFVEYEAISEFSLGVYTQPSREPLGEKDYFIEAGKLAKQKAEGVDEKFEKLYPRKRYLIAMADIGTGKLRAWDCSKSQFNNFVAQLEEYKELIEDGEQIVFNFKRSGNSTDTTYTLQPVMKKLTAKEQESYDSFDNVEADIPFFESLLQPRTPKLQVAVLKEKGFPVEKYFPEIGLDSEGESVGATPEAEEASPLDSI
ncbi:MULTISPECIES: hypothetical protein [Bacteria]|uniref:Uncharacterized protein n=1 Tax=Enterococcus gallinarum TaxID=1353 RepID=A0ABD4ZST9_ENTGA|nr:MULTISPECIES: hypothetical protein [Bacteria]MDL4875158.1 hypothetical protein [Enterococcus gallinarum]MDL4880570.1 hypothetical protein [Enterococcus gallinarum]MDL4884119.1 hypothetical protein [Enterococcus gallinarum]MDL4892847.1 hypothetical protein [Enterococcus gallinarum]MDL4920740.1 hypothetical protein [Enterococcus gallinarum]